MSRGSDGSDGSDASEVSDHPTPSLAQEPSQEPNHTAPPRVIGNAPPASIRERRIAIILVVFTTIVGGVGTALSPYLLIHHPAWLIALSPDVRHFVLCATSLDLTTMLAIGVPRRIFGMYTAWALGHAYGSAAMSYIEQRYPRAIRGLRFIERTFVRHGPLLLVVWPSYTLATMAGVVRTRFVIFLVGTSLGQLVYVLVSYSFGSELGSVTDAFLDWLRAHVLEATALCAALVATQVLFRWWRGARKRAAAAKTTS